MTLTLPDEVAEVFLGVQYREATLDALDTEQRTISMRALPYNVEAQIGPHLYESFEPAAFARAAKAPSRCKLWHGHSVTGGSIVGQAFGVEDRADGVYVQTRVSHTPSGDELLTLAKDGVLDEASIEFAPIREFMVVKRRGEDIVVRHRRAHLRGVGLVPHGAYSREAVVTAVRDVREKLAEEKVARLRLLTH